MRSDYGGKKILIVDDESDIRDFLRWEFEDRNAQVFDGGSSDEGFEIFVEQCPDFSLLDIRMPSGNGVDLLHRCKVHLPSAPIALMTGYTEISVSQIYAKGACEIFLKPIKYLHLFPRVDKELKSLDEKLEFELPPGKYPEIDFSDKFQDLLDQKRFHLGRGGISLQVSASEPGEVGQFTQLNMSHDQWIIAKICWIEKGLKSTTSFGLEIVQISETLKPIIKKILGAIEAPAFIPSIEGL